MNQPLVHATCVAIDGKGVLLRGCSGAGKSDLALRLIEGGARLVADDQVALVAKEARLVAAPPPALAGRLEVRGVGIVELPYQPEVTLALIVKLVPGDAVERLPQPGFETIAGVRVPLIALAPFEASAPAKIRLALTASGDDSLRDPA